MSKKSEIFLSPNSFPFADFDELFYLFFLFFENVRDNDLFSCFPLKFSVGNWDAVGQN